jgi:transaldolase
MTRLQRLYDEQQQSPWPHNLTRVYLRDGTLTRLVSDGIRGVTANPTILARTIEGSEAYDQQSATLIDQGRPVMDDADRTLEDQGVATFHQSFARVLRVLETKARRLAPR